MIRKANINDMSVILKIYAKAREFMASHGNKSQWGSYYPSVELLIDDIKNNQLYLYENDGKVRGVFAFIIGEDPTYQEIADGAWNSDSLYGTIHRVASDGKEKGIFSKVAEFCWDKIPHLRIDTHEDNKIMQYLILKNGFTRCGTIFLDDGSPRIAFEKL